MDDNSKFSKHDGEMLNADEVRKLWTDHHSAKLNDILEVTIEFLDDLGKASPDHIDYDRVSVAGMLRNLLAEKLAHLHTAPPEFGSEVGRRG